MDMEINIELEIGRDDFPAFYAKIDKSYVRQNTLHRDRIRNRCC